MLRGTKRLAALPAVIATTVIGVGAPAGTVSEASTRDLSPPLDALCPPWYGDINLIVGCSPHRIPLAR